MTIAQQRKKIEQLGSPNFIQSLSPDEKEIAKKHIRQMVEYLTLVDIAGSKIIKSDGYNPAMWDEFKATVARHKTPTLRTMSISRDLLQIIISNWNDCVACAEKYLVLVWNKTGK